MNANSASNTGSTVYEIKPALSFFAVAVRVGTVTPATS